MCPFALVVASPSVFNVHWERITESSIRSPFFIPTSFFLPFVLRLLFLSSFNIVSVFLHDSFGFHDFLFRCLTTHTVLCEPYTWTIFTYFVQDANKCKCHKIMYDCMMFIQDKSICCCCWPQSENAALRLELVRSLACLLYFFACLTISLFLVCDVILNWSR